MPYKRGLHLMPKTTGLQGCPFRPIQPRPIWKLGMFATPSLAVAFEVATPVEELLSHAPHTGPVFVFPLLISNLAHPL